LRFLTRGRGRVKGPAENKKKKKHMDNEGKEQGKWATRDSYFHECKQLKKKKQKKKKKPKKN